MSRTILPCNCWWAVARRPAPLILYHGRRCPDGFGASLAAWLYYGDSAEYRGLDHGEIQTADDLGDLDGRAVYVLDFAFEPELLAAIEARVSSWWCWTTTRARPRS
jgi:hypothetical protein